MNVASLSLCRELYELSGWETGTTGFCYYNNEMLTFGWMEDAIPAYDLGYLLRKLPHVINENEHRGDYFVLEPITADKWAASYGNRTSDEWADTPEDAACKLAIVLFKQGILTKA